ncbi:MAG: abf2 1 [Gemmataceae bacterium]|nr:abf2 1 [Gemmataceae bacterium]
MSSPAGRFRPALLTLETRDVPATLTVDAGSTIRPVPDQLHGVNLAWWDSLLTTPQTRQMVQNAGLQLFRFPGGSSSDTFHFNAPPAYNGYETVAQFAQFIAQVGGTGMVTLDYGTGSPQEAAAFLSYLNASTTNTTAIGSGPQWSDTSNAWVTKDWKTAGYWAALRAATPLATDDGLNFLRLGRSQPFGVTYAEVGNEVYGNWETDHHATPHDPATYVTFTTQFAQLAGRIDASVSIGVCGSGTAGNYGSVGGVWTDEVLKRCATAGYTPGFISDHDYMGDPGPENDANLLLHSANDPGAVGFGGPINFPGRAAAYRQLLTTDLGAAGANVRLLATEINSVSYNPGKQTTSLVNGLWLADALGGMLGTEYVGAVVWDLRNGYSTGNNNAATLYGWRQGGDYGLLGDPNSSAGAPTTGGYVAYPTYFAEQLFGTFAASGDTVVSAASNDPLLTAYAVRKADGHLALLVVNKSATSALTGNVQVAGFTPAATATRWQYGKAQDNAQQASGTGAAALAQDTPTLTLAGNTFSLSFPAYSMTVLDLAPAAGGTGGPTIATPAAANPNPVSGTTTGLTALGADPAGETGLTYTWAATASPVGAPPPAFSVNGTNAAKATTATFGAAGSYTLQVTVRDASGLTATSQVVVTVGRTLTILSVSPTGAVIPAGGTQAFSALGTDQFGASFTPTVVWSVDPGGVGSIDPAGLYMALGATGTATVRATADGLQATAGVTISSLPPVLLVGVTPFAVGADAGGSPAATVYNPNGSVAYTVTPFPSASGGVRTAVADFNGDGVPDLAVGTGPGAVAEVIVYDGKTRQVLFDVKPFADFTGGVFVTAGDIAGDGTADLVVTPDLSGGPRVEVYRGGDFALVANFFGIADPIFRGGARAGVGDLNHDGHADMVVSAGFGGGPRISVFDGAALLKGQFVHPVPDFFAFEPALRNGAYVAVGDVNGDGTPDLIFGAGPGGGPRVLAVSGQALVSGGSAAALGSPVANFFAGNVSNRGGVRVAVKNLDNDRFADVLTGAGRGGGSGVTAYLGKDLSVGTTAPDLGFDAFPGFTGGVFVG